MKKIFAISILFGLLGCSPQENELIEEATDKLAKYENKTHVTSLVVLGNVQDAGSPHAACVKDCCKDLFTNPDSSRMVVSLGLIDSKAKKTFLFEATPDITRQMKMLKELAPFEANEIPDGIFLTHAHIGHYSGLMYLGKEACNADKAQVFAMPRMKKFLENNGPWSQLVTNKNIKLVEMIDAVGMAETKNISVCPYTVPHRDEYSETVGFLIKGPKKIALFIPDIDKWDKWDQDIISKIKKVDYAFLDATFYDGDELNTRDISQIPHPFVVESMELFKDLPKEEKAKIHFIHFNHTNALLKPDSEQSKKVKENGFNIARLGDRFEL
jgi:pyrroloquinoline quinone biosynthesis protein B